MFTRRTLLRASSLAASLAATLVLPSCSTGPTAAVVISDLQSAFTAFQNEMPALATADPALAAKIQPYVTDASNLLAGLTASSPTMTSTLTTIDGIINSILSAAAASGVVPAPYNLLVEGLSVLVPEVEPLINSLITSAAAKPYPHPSVPDVSSARAVFRRFGG